jgi:hypothetical protein
MTKRIFPPKGEGMEGLRKMHKKELSPSIISMI